jgi:ATP-dependent Lon protease
LAVQRTDTGKTQEKERRRCYPGVRRKNTRAADTVRLDPEKMYKRQVATILSLLSGIYGADRLVLKAGKLEALAGIRSDRLEEQVLALQRIVFEDPTIETPPSMGKVPQVLDEIQEEIADIIARKTVEDTIEKKIAERMQKKHEEYLKEIRNQVLEEENGGSESAQTLKKLATLEKLDQKSLSQSVLEVLRPRNLSEVVGQAQAVKALLTKLSSPFPQHVLLYGPPGVGKTTVARLVLEEAKRMKHSPFKKDAPFVEVDGTTLRWDPRDVTNPLLGSVHDPIYQGARRDLADGGVPEPKLGLVTEAHGGVLFIDEIAELDPILQNKLLKVLEDKRVTYDSSYYDPDDPRVPKYIKKIFEEGAPADFVLIGATTRDSDEVSAALRSRCAEVFFDPLTPEDTAKIVRAAARKLGVSLQRGVPSLISQYTTEGRKAIGILADAYSLALNGSGDPACPRKRSSKSSETGLAEETRPRISKDIVLEVLQNGRFRPAVVEKAKGTAEVARIFGLGVLGYMGSVIEIEAVTFPAREKGRGTVRFNEAAGNMARDSVFNALSVVRQITGEDVTDYDIHVNVVGGGLIDGPSAGLAMALVIASAMKQIPIRQDVAVTGEISIQGKVKGVGGIHEKIYGARQAGMKKIIIPEDNRNDVGHDTSGIEVVEVKSAEEALRHIAVSGN